MDELDRLGRPGAYRLGAPGAWPERPRQHRPSFARANRRGSVLPRVLALAAGTAAVAGGVIVGLFFVPLLVGLVAGLVARSGGWRLRVTLPAAVVMAALGCGIPLAWQAWQAEPHGAPGRTVAGISGVLGLPAHEARGAIAVLLAGVLQALAGVWLGRVLAERRARRTAAQASDTRTDRDGETKYLVRLVGDNALRTGPQPPVTTDATATP